MSGHIFAYDEALESAVEGFFVFCQPCEDGVKVIACTTPKGMLGYALHPSDAIRVAYTIKACVELDRRSKTSQDENSGAN